MASETQSKVPAAQRGSVAGAGSTAPLICIL